jgi:hypothetical protein
LAVPGTGQTVKMTNNGTGLVPPIPGYADTVIAVGREYVLSTEDRPDRLIDGREGLLHCSVLIRCLDLHG